MLGDCKEPGRAVDAVILMASVLLVLLVSSGCTSTDYRMYTGVEGQALSAQPVWPIGAEVPRYRFAGLYYGEQNLRPRESEQVKSGLQKTLSWLVGISKDKSLEQLQSPQSGVMDDLGILYVTDVLTGSIFVFDEGDAEASSKVLIWQNATAGQTFVAPIAIALDHENRLLVTDAELGRVYRIDRQGKPVDDFGAGILVRPTGIARDAERGEIYIADTHAHDVKVFSDEGELLRTIGRRGSEEGQFNFPIHISLKGEELYVVDSMNARIQILDKGGKFLRGFGSRGKFMGQFSRPKGIAVDSEGNIYVVDSYFDYLLVFSATGEFLLPIGGTGESIGSFYLPADVWIDEQDTIYVADTGNGRVVTFQFLGGD